MIIPKFAKILIAACLVMAAGCASRPRAVACNGTVERINPPAAYSKPNSAANLACPAGVA